MNTFQNLPLYELTLDDSLGIQLMSIVNSPAIQIGFLKFSDEKIKQNFSIDDDKHIITGPAMIPELPIYRIIDGVECFVKFSADTIKQLEEKFMREQRTLSVNLEHETPTSDCTIIESFFINHERGITPLEFNDLPNGTWMLSMKVNNDAIWHSIKHGALNGFSIEGIFNLDSNQFCDNENTKDEAFCDWLFNQFQ